MFESLKELSVKDSITIDDSKVKEFTEAEDYDIVNIKTYSCEEGEIVILELDNNYFMIAHTLSGDPRYYIYELNLSGTCEDLEDDGMSILNREGELKSRIAMRVNIGIRNRINLTLIATYGPIYGLTMDRNDQSPDDDFVELNFCEYKGRSKKHYRSTAVEQCDNIFNVYQGFRFSEKSIVL
jgi:hypothetical protein